MGDTMRERFKREEPLELEDTFDFGKLEPEGLTLSEAIEVDPKYVLWCTGVIAGFHLSEEAEAVLASALER